MTQLVTELSNGRLALVCDDLDDATVWQSAREHNCHFVVMVPEGIEWLRAHLDRSRPLVIRRVR